MKGLIRKDLYVLFSACRLQLLIVTLFAGAAVLLEEQVSYLCALTAVMAAMLPMTLMAYDEQSRFDRFAFALPVSRAEIVLGKYAVTLLSVLWIAVVYVLGGLLSAAFGLLDLAQWNLGALAGMLTLPLIAPALYLPLAFRFGVEKGRIWVIIFMAVFGAAAFALTQLSSVSAEISVPGLLEGFSPWLLPPAALLLFGLSAFVSVQLYKKREL